MEGDVHSCRMPFLEHIGNFSRGVSSTRCCHGNKPKRLWVCVNLTGRRFRKKIKTSFGLRESCLSDLPPIMAADRDDFVFQAKLSEQAERYEGKLFSYKR